MRISITRKELGAALSVLLVSGLAAGPGLAQVDDDFYNHANCFKVKADLKLKGDADYSSPIVGILDSGFEDSSCKVRSVSHVCLSTLRSDASVELDKESVDVRDMDGSSRRQTQICYKVKCDKQDLPDWELTDPFGSYTITKQRPQFACAPAVSTCVDPGRTVFGGGPRTGQNDPPGSCNQFDDQTSCEQAWVAARRSSVLVPTTCYWDGDSCEGCGVGNGSNEQNENCVNTCVSCADETRERTITCRDFDGDQTACEDAWQVGGTGPVSCWYDTDGVAGRGDGACLGCGPDNEIRSDYCTNACGNQNILFLDFANDEGR